MLMDSLKLVREKCSPEESEEFSRNGPVLGATLFLLMETIYREHSIPGSSGLPKRNSHCTLAQEDLLMK